MGHTTDKFDLQAVKRTLHSAMREHMHKENTGRKVNHVMKELQQIPIWNFNKHRFGPTMNSDQDAWKAGNNQKTAKHLSVCN